MISVHRGASRTDRESRALLGLSTHTSFLVVDSAHVRPLGSEGIHSTPKATEMQRIERTIIYGNIDTIWHRHPCLLDVFERAFVFGHERAACLAAELFRRPSQHESPKGDGATGSNTGRRTFVLRQIQTFLEYSWTYLGTSARDGIPLFRHTRLSRSNPRDLLAVRSTHPVRRASPTASHNHLGAGTVLSRWSTIYKHTSLVITVS